MAIPSPSSRQPNQRIEWVWSSDNDLPPLEAAREVCSADGPDGARETPRITVFSIPKPECPRRRHGPGGWGHLLANAAQKCPQPGASPQCVVAWG
jgi:hypothetical protein